MFLLAAVLILGHGLPAAELSLGRGTTPAGARVDIPVQLKTEGAAIAALQFDLDYDEALLTITGTAGPAAEKASKRLTSKGKRFMVFGLNHNNLADGVLVLLTVEVKANAPSRDHPLKLNSALAANSAGGSIPLRLANGVITVTPPKDP